MEDMRKIIDSLDEDDRCVCCKFDDDCPKGTRNYGSGPEFPACAEMPEDFWFDMDKYNNMISEMEEEEMDSVKE